MVVVPMVETTLSTDPAGTPTTEKLSVMRPDGVDNFNGPGRPIATISNVMLEYRPGPPPK